MPWSTWRRLVQKKIDRFFFFSSYSKCLLLLLTSLKVCDWSGYIFGASGSPSSLRNKSGYVTLFHCSWRSAWYQICGIRVANACGICGWRNLCFYAWTTSIQCATYDVQYLMCEERLWFAMCGIIILEMFKVWCLMPEVCCLMIAAYRPKFDVFTVWTWMSESWCSVFDVRRATIVAFLCSLVAGVWCLMIGLSCGLWSDVRCSKCWCSTFDVQ